MVDDDEDGDVVRTPDRDHPMVILVGWLLSGACEAIKGMTHATGPNSRAAYYSAKVGKWSCGEADQPMRRRDHAHRVQHD